MFFILMSLNFLIIILIYSGNVKKILNLKIVSCTLCAYHSAEYLVEFESDQTAESLSFHFT